MSKYFRRAKEVVEGTTMVLGSGIVYVLCGGLSNKPSVEPERRFSNECVYKKLEGVMYKGLGKIGGSDNLFQIGERKIAKTEEVEIRMIRGEIDPSDLAEIYSI